MFYSRIQYPAQQGQSVFAVPFPYLDKAYVEVRVAGALQDPNTGYSWPTATSIALPAGLSAGTIVEIRRNTPKAARLVTFRDASMLTEGNLNTSADQVFDVAQEVYDDMATAVRVGADGTIDAQGLRIKNGAAPTVGTDFATKDYVDVVSLSNIQTVAGQAQNSATQAASSATAAANSATSAASSATSAANSATAAASAAVAAASAQGSATAAGGDAAAAAASAASAASSATAASTSSGQASTSAANAASSATAASSSATGASSSATSAAASATSAAASATTATTKATDATNSASTASTYATNSAASATSAAASASSAAASAAAAQAASAGNAVKVSSTDTTPGDLSTKIIVTGALTKTVTNSGADERLSFGVAVPVTSVFGRTGAVTLSSSDVTGALGYTPPNPNGTMVASLNADLLDGNHASAFAAASHTHSGYVSTDMGNMPVGISLPCVANNSVGCNMGATISGGYLNSYGVMLSGTWRNIGPKHMGAAVGADGYFQRIA